MQKQIGKSRLGYRTIKNEGAPFFNMLTIEQVGSIARGMYESRSVVAPFFSLSFFRGSFTSGFREGERTKIEPKREPQRS